MSSVSGSAKESLMINPSRFQLATSVSLRIGSMSASSGTSSVSSVAGRRRAAAGKQLGVLAGWELAKLEAPAAVGPYVCADAAVLDVLGRPRVPDGADI